MAADKKRGFQTARDMVLSLIVVSLVAGVVYLTIPHDDKRDPVRPIGYEVELTTARRAAPYPVAGPEGLSKDWRATSVTYEGAPPDPVVWHLGFISPKDEYVQVEQSDGRLKPFIRDTTKGAKATGRSVRIDGVEWKLYKGKKYDGLVREEPEATTIVAGTASLGELKLMASSLKLEKADPSGQTPSSPAPGSPGPSSPAPSSSQKSPAQE